VNRGRKTVTSIALGVGLAIVASAVVTELNGPADGGWFMYSPNSTSLYNASSSGSILRTASVWLAAVAIWLAVSWRLLRSDE
jgi:hypothetical protein